MLKDNDYRPFDPAFIAKAGKDDQAFMNDWNTIFIARKEYLEQILADQKFDIDAYKHGMQKIEDNGLDSLETQIMQNPMYGGGVILDPINGIPDDPTIPMPTPINGNPNIPNESAYMGNGTLKYYPSSKKYDPRNNKDGAKHLQGVYDQSYEKTTGKKVIHPD